MKRVMIASALALLCTTELSAAGLPPGVGQCKAYYNACIQWCITGDSNTFQPACFDRCYRDYLVCTGFSLP